MMHLPKGVDFIMAAELAPADARPRVLVHYGDSCLQSLAASCWNICRATGQELRAHVGDKLVQSVHAEGVGVFVVSDKDGHSSWGAKRRMHSELKRAQSKLARELHRRAAISVAP